MCCEELLQLATEMEGHPDNVAPSIYGGINYPCNSHQCDMGGGPRLNAQLALSKKSPDPRRIALSRRAVRGSGSPSPPQTSE